ncbi:MAG: 30S ribosomal protein S6--L-glutamate ligase [Magnetococcales bacterium]|nr:30S ribosomal protein S6--L-glutamate ligase [Magnetococcales bacterium]MBF0115905.1 30S ribosomal protein S6--L-glutamate ligase [Magnetococcales bacterium]
MKIVLLARNPTLYSHRRLVEAAEQRGHTIQVINTLLVYMNITSNRPEIRYKGEVLRGFDAVIPRIGASITFYGLAVLNQFEMTGVYPLNNAESIARSRDKLRCLQLLAGSGIGLPVTGFAHSTQFTDDLIAMVGGAPVVIKLLEGTQGIGVVLAETPRSAKSMIEAFRGIHANILVQEYIREANARDLRCLVVGDRVVAAIQRQGKSGEFRSNLHRGGTATAVRITPEERSVAVRSAKLMGLSVAGVDMLRSKHGPVVLEINSSPGLEGLETATGIDVAGKMIEFLAKKVEERARSSANQSRSPRNRARAPRPASEPEG